MSENPSLTSSPSADFPAVSAIIPCYNHGAFLEEALESVRAQVLPADEIIVVDDGSTEPATLAVLEAVEKSGCRVLRQENSGPAAARNHGIQEASGPLLLCLDADDRLLPSFLEKTVPLLAANDRLGIAYGRAAYFGRETGVSSLPPYQFPDFLLDPCIFSTALFRKKDWQEVGGYRNEMRSGWEDFEFWISLIELGCEVAFLDEVLFEYRKHDGSRDDSFASSRDRVLDAFMKIFSFHPELYTANIRLLFAAHLERREWQSFLPESWIPEIRFPDLGESGTVLPAVAPVQAGEEVQAWFPLEGFTSVARLRFDPMEGPGWFFFEGLEFRSPANEALRVYSSHEIEWIGHSFARKCPDGALFFLDRDPQISFALPAETIWPKQGWMVIRYSTRTGPAIAGEFFQQLGQASKDFEELCSLRLECAHLKSELQSEIGRRRKVQSSRIYRWSRPFSRMIARIRNSPE